jgi:hypothetical protein
MDSLRDDEADCYLVTTESSSRYWLDLDRRLLRRETSTSFAGTLRLRRDGEELDLVEVVDCRVGHPLIVLINLNLTGVWLTTRESTPVVRIERLQKPLIRP